MTALTLTLSLAFSSCSGLSDQEIVEIASALLEDSYEINRIFYGTGVPLDSRSLELAKEQLTQDSDVRIAAYAEVDAEYPYKCTEDLKNAALKVYTAAYCEGMFEVAFFGHKDSATGALVEYARFIDNEYGILTQRVDIEDEIIYTGRTYDINTVNVVRQGVGYVLFTVDSVLDGKPSDTVKIKMMKDQDGSWKLDNPTY